MTKTIPKPENKTKAQQISLIFKKHKALMKEYYKMVPFEQPIMFFIKRTGQVTFHEKVTLGRYEFEHSTGVQRYIIIDRNQLEFKIGDKKVKGYICHEDFPYPLPNTPELTTEMFDITIDKTLHDRREWEAKAIKAKTDLIVKVGLVIGGLILAYGLYKLMAPPEPTLTAEQILAQEIAKNITILKGG